jgi:acyl-CoA synthetase (AMP-forming)/AMP-acid ligase II
MITVDQAIPKDIAKTALIIPDGPIWAFSMLEEKVAHLSENFKTIGIGHNDRIAFVHPQDHAFVASFLALLRIGAHAAPLNPTYHSEEFKFYLEVIQPKAVLVPNAIPESIQEAAHMLHIPLLTIDPSLRLQSQGHICQSTPTSPSPDDTALFLHTSGTTGRPKGVPLRHRNLLDSMRNIATTLQLTAADTGLCIMPLFHIHGLMVSLLSPLSRGATVVLAPRFSASQFWRWVKDHQVNWFSAVPTIHQTLLNRAEEDEAPYPSPFRFIRSSSSPLAVPVLEAMESRFGCPVLEAYGMTEATHQIASNPLPPEERRPGTVGKGFGVKIAILSENNDFLPPGQEGEVVIQGDNVIDHYENNPEADAKSFFQDWFRTGDVGVLSEDGYLTLKGRIKELINRGGEKIAPPEIDQVLLAHPKIKEAASFPLPDPKYGEIVACAIIPREKNLTVDEIIAFCTTRLSAFKVPSRVFFVDELPKNPTGKIQRTALTAHFKGEKA